MASLLKTAGYRTGVVGKWHLGLGPENGPDWKGEIKPGPRVPHPRFKGTSSVGTRGDTIHELDDSVGTVLAALDRLHLADNTLVIFTSDNGGVMDDGYEDVGSFDYHPNAPLRGVKGSLWEGGHRVPFLARWPDRIKPGTTSAALIAHLDMPATLAALVGTAVPEGQCRDSVNVLPALLGESSHGRETFVAHSGGTRGPFALRRKNATSPRPSRRS